MAKFLRIVAALLGLCLIAVGGSMYWTKTETKTYPADTGAFSSAMMGYAPDIRERGNTDATLYYLGLTWRELEPEEGCFDWETLDKKYGLTELRGCGVHLVLRFICDYPGEESHLDIPDWLYEQTGDGSWYSISYGKGYSPNYSNAIFRAAHTKAVAALGEYFGQDNFACYVELGSLGHWGEWHIKSDEDLVPMPGENIRDEYVEVYLTAFSSAKLLMRRPFSIAAKNGLGVYNDMTGSPRDTAEWLGWLENGGWYANEKDALSAMPDFWLTAPVGGEFTSSISMEEMMGEELPRTLDLLDASHVTFLGPKIPDKEAYAEGCDAVLEHIGYRLRIDTATLKQTLRSATLALTWTNDGAAPFYWDWDVKVSVADADGRIIETKQLPLKLSSLAPGTEQTVKVDLASLRLRVFSAETKSYRIIISIIDPMTGQNAVQLAMQGERTENGEMVLCF